MAGAFISYAREDEPFARRLYDALTLSGREPTWDQDHAVVPFSSRWRAEIRAAIENSDKFIFVISPDSLASQPCASELEQALEAGKQVIPILRRAPREGQAIAGAIEELNWISFSDDASFDRSVRQLTAALDTDLAWAKSHARLAVRSAEWARADRERSLLLRGSDLRHAETWLAGAASHPLSPPTGQQRQFIAASRGAADRSARRWRGVLAAGLVVALALALVALLQRNQAQHEARVAVSGQVAARSVALDASDPVTAAQLAAAAWRIAPTALARASLLDVLAQPARAVLSPGSGGSQVAFSPDGKILATAGTYGVVQLWNMVTRRQLGRPMTVGHNLGTSVAFSPDGKMIVTGSGDGLARLWDVATQREIGAPFSVRTGEVGSVAFSPDGKIIATVSGGQVRLWNTATLDQIGMPMTADPGAEGFVDAIAFRPSGRTLVTATGDGQVQVWDVATQRPVGVPMMVSGGCFCTSAFSRDGGTVASASGDVVSFWSLTARRRVGVPVTTAAGRDDPAVVLAFSPDGKTIATGSADGRARLWNVASGSQLGLPLTVATSPDDEVEGLGFSPDGQTLATGTHYGRVWLWNMAAHGEIGVPTPEADATSGVAFSPNGTVLAIASYGGLVRLWNVLTQKWLGAPLVHTSYSALTVAVSPDGNTVSAASLDGRVWSWNLKTRQQAGPVMTTAAGHGGSVTVAFSPDGRTLAAASDDGPLRLWSIVTRRQLGAPLAGRGYDVRGMAFSPGGKILATVNNGGAVQFWDVAADQKLGAPIVTSAPLGVPFGAVVFSPDGTTLATVNDAGDVLLWDVASHRQLGIPLTTGAAPVVSMAFSPDSSILAAASADGLVRLWDIATGSQLGAPLTLSTGGAPTVVDFSPDAKTLVTAGGSIRLWNVAFPRDLLGAVCAIAGRSLTRQQWNTYVPSQPFQQACP